ncbi:hypothetical protein [Paractinoplanes maris]|uniref:hypothetical protein n=1 Tax=Paractinoplanes maris TaxID=1734446 RepID=UPI0020202E20|nr:hypothetical protein [Actinoplanes maris]
MCPLTWDVDTGPQSTFVAVHGRPDTSSLLALRAALKRLLARRPDCLILDLPDMPASDRIVVTGSSLTIGYSTMASGTTILLSPEPPIDVAARRHELGRSPAVTGRFAHACEALAVGLLRSPSFVEQILPISGSARAARDIVTQACLAWDLTHLTGAAALLASELVSQTVRRASTIMTVVALLDRGILYLWVRAGRQPPPEPPDEHCAALESLVIDALADRWGLLPDGDDKVIWAAMPVEIAAAR